MLSIVKKTLLISILSMFLINCGGGGGGSGLSASSAINWTTSATSIGLSAYVRDYGSSMSSNSHNFCQPSSQSCSIGAEVDINASSDAITLYSDHGYRSVNYSSGYTFPASSISSVATDTTNYTLTSTNYTYSHYDAANGYTKKITVMVPSTYSNQTWLYWDNTDEGDSYNTYYIGVFGTYTPYASLPSSGTATYTGGAEMIYITQDYAYSGGSAASFSVDWATKKISGTISAMPLTATGSSVTFPAITMASTDIVESSQYVNASNQNLAYFWGDLSYSGMGAQSGNEINGTFFGSGYEEIGGTFALTSSSSNDGAGYFAAKR